MNPPLVISPSLSLFPDTLSEPEAINSPVYDSLLDDLCFRRRRRWLKEDYLQQFKIQSLCAVHGLDRILFITLGFRNPQPDFWGAKASLRVLLRSLFWRRHVSQYVCAFEEGERNGNPHFHLVALMRWDVGRDQFNFAGLKRRGIPLNESPVLWDFWQGLKAASLVAGFGDFVQAVPIKDVTKTSRYVGGYFAKDARADRFRRGLESRRYFQYSRGCPGGYSAHGNPRFSWNSPFAWVRRQQTRLYLSLHPEHENFFYPPSSKGRKGRPPKRESNPERDAAFAARNSVEGWGAPSDSLRQCWKSLGFKSWNSLDLISLPQ